MPSVVNPIQHLKKNEHRFFSNSFKNIEEIFLNSFYEVYYPYTQAKYCGRPLNTAGLNCVGQLKKVCM